MDPREAINSFIDKELKLGIKPTYKEDRNKVTALYTLPNDDVYGVVFSKLDRSDNLDLLDENQLVTEQGSNIIYQTTSTPVLIISLLADYINERYTLNVTANKEKSNG